MKIESHKLMKLHRHRPKNKKRLFSRSTFFPLPGTQNNNDIFNAICFSNHGMKDIREWCLSIQPMEQNTTIPFIYFFILTPITQHMCCTNMASSRPDEQNKVPTFTVHTCSSYCSSTQWFGANTLYYQRSQRRIVDTPKQFYDSIFI